ncbi:glycosyltransferase family 4 protein [Cellulophaga sp. 20_2_10]|uniref:glycosyltransferase family 4 protein n=1 Tax=Cellulophaga sp. 20_2_10 TaxID=2942476 RepID=UPI00201AEC70|nr:glycosyltransferase family 4 protein [Cellulophaga sp. 20_2_10]MCL5247332.1 glycosyltransferase family 4 protein [Cellulophaga sp. 20_2_10]
MKIFLISNMFPSSKDPVYGVFVKNFRDQLLAQGMRFSCYSLIFGKSHLIFGKILKYAKYYISIGFNFIKKDYDVIYVHYLSHNTPILLFLLFLFGKSKPIIINTHGSDVTKSKDKYIDKLNERLLKKIDLIVVPSQYFKELILKQYLSLEEENVFVSPSGGINRETFYCKINKESNKEFRLGFVSRIDKNKGWDDFVNALRILEKDGVNFKALIAGRGDDVDELLDLISVNKLQQKIIYVGVLDQNQLCDFYNELDVFVFPSKLSESLGLVGLEAMSCGIPVIGSGIAGIKTYVKNNFNGFLFEPGNIQDLADCIKQYSVFSDIKKNEFSLNAINTSEKYDSKYVTKNLILKLKEIVIL